MQSLNNSSRWVMMVAFVALVNSGATAKPISAPEATPREAALPFREVPDLEQAFIDAAPQDRADDIVVGRLGKEGGNPDMILQLANEVAAGNLGQFDSLLIAHQGKLLFESYYSRGRINLPHPQASATKAYTALALGRAIQLGHMSMADLDRPLVDFLKDLDPTKWADGVAHITLRKALTMRSGLRISEDQMQALEQDPKELKGQRQVQAYLAHSAPITENSQTFKYQMDPTLVMQVIDAVVPGSARDFIHDELLLKLGITNYHWRTDHSGLPTAGSRASLTSRDMLKLGLLVANQGRWQGEALISEDYLSMATDRLLYTGDEDFHYGGDNTSGQGYGFYWWSADLMHNNKRYFSQSAQGGWGQFVVLIKELDLLVVMTAHDNNAGYLQIIAERILPAFVPKE